MIERSGVSWYTVRTAEVKIAFPEDKITCSNCVLFCRYQEPYKRYTCRLTDEILPHPFAGIGWRCPFFEEEEKDEEIPKSERDGDRVPDL